jgi:hypothetical protein
MLSTLQNEFSLLRVIFNGTTILYNDRYEDLRRQEMYQFIYNFKGIDTIIIFDAKHDSVQSALFSIYTTSFVTVLLMVSIYHLSFFFSLSLSRHCITLSHLLVTVRSDSYSLLPQLLIITISFDLSIDSLLFFLLLSSLYLLSLIYIFVYVYLYIYIYPDWYLLLFP